jgi:hypothetical protein
MAREPIKITCPCCNTILIIDPQEGEVLEQRKPILEESTGDRLKDAFIKAQKRHDDAESIFQKAKEKDKDRRSKFDDLFKESLEKAKENDDGTPPHNPMDL